MSTQYVESPVPATNAASRGAFNALAARLKAASLGAMHGAWEFLKAVGEMRVRQDMLATAARVAATQPQLAARLRRAAREGWAQ